MKTYERLPLPKDSAWSRKTWRSHAPIWLLDIVDGIKSVFRWLPTIYKDQNWDDFYITKILQKKIEFQREYLVKSNRHMGVQSCNFWMTILLNLLEKENTEAYYMEYLDSFESKILFIEDELTKNSFEMKMEVLSENYDAYIKKYQSAARKILKENPKLHSPNKKDKLCFEISLYNQKRCRHLIFEILKEKSDRWWD